MPTLFPAVLIHLEAYRDRLEARAGKQLWWQLQASPSFLDLFEKPKIIWQEIQFHSAYCIDVAKYLTNNKAFIFPSSNTYLLAVLNSPLLWWFTWRYLPHMKDEALNPAGYLMETLPIASPTDEIRTEVEPLVTRLIEITRTDQEVVRDLQDWLRVEYGMEKMGGIVEALKTEMTTGRSPLQSDDFITAVKKHLPKKIILTPAQVKALRQTYTDYAPPLHERAREAKEKERRLADLINQAYGLTTEEVELLWKTAPPRMPGTVKSTLIASLLPC